jgi:hypothetical protein
VRQLARQERSEKRTRHPSSLVLSADERQAVLDAVHQPRFADRIVPHIYATIGEEYGVERKWVVDELGDT